MPHSPHRPHPPSPSLRPEQQQRPPLTDRQRLDARLAHSLIRLGAGRADLRDVAEQIVADVRAICRAEISRHEVDLAREQAGDEDGVA